MKKYGDLILGIIILVFGLTYFILTKQIPERNIGLVTARFIPNILSISMFILGTLQLIAGYRKVQAVKAAAGEDCGFVCVPSVGAENKPKDDYATVIKTLISIVLYIAFLDNLGFLITTAIYLFAQFVVLTPVDKKKNYVQYAVIAIVTSAVIYFIFRNGLDLMLPAGILS